MGGDYFSFVLIGIAFSDYLGVGLGSFAGTIREGQMLGTLEAMLVTPTRVHSIILFSSIWQFLHSFWWSILSYYYSARLAAEGLLFSAHYLFPQGHASCTPAKLLFPGIGL